MLNRLISQVALGLLVQAARERDEELARLFWDLKYLYLFGLEPLPEVEPDLPFQPGPRPDPVPFRQVGLHGEVLFGLTDLVADGGGPAAVADDPSPQPSLGLGFVLTNPDVRLKAAKGMRKRLEDAAGHLDDEIGRLQEVAKAR